MERRDFLILKTKLILFDIDGTLLTSGGAGEKALRLEMRDLVGHDGDFSKIEIAGRGTDSGIARQLFALQGIEPTVENFARFFDGYLRHLAVTLPGTSGRLLPGIMELLQKLRVHPGVALGLLTGNLERGAKLKLTHYGVWDFFEFGAYADDHHDRNQLGHFAPSRAKERHGIEFAPENIYVLGDTPHDIACGRAIGAKTVAIATGNQSREQLAAHGPDYLFDEIFNVPEVMAAFGL